MLQSNGSETRVYLPPELSTLMVNYQLAQNSSYTLPKTRNQTLTQSFYILYNSLRDLTTSTAYQLETFE